MSAAATASERCCAVCGASIEGRRPDALTCDPSCRRERSRLLRLLAGESVEGYQSVAEYLKRRQDACEAPPKIGLVEGQGATTTRTARVGQFVVERCQRRPGQLTLARSVYAAYVEWCRTCEPDAPLSRSAFGAALERRAPIEDRMAVGGYGRGRPPLAYRGIALVDPVPSQHRREAA